MTARDLSKYIVPKGVKIFFDDLGRPFEKINNCKVMLSLKYRPHYVIKH